MLSINMIFLHVSIPDHMSSVSMVFRHVILVQSRECQHYQLSEIKAFLRIAEDMGIMKKNLNKVKVETETSRYKENFDFEMTWEDEVDIELDNILSNYNPAEALATETKGSE